MKGSSVLRLVSRYEQYRRKTLNLIPSENILSKEVLKALSTRMGGRYAGKPETYGGSKVFHEIWSNCEKLSKEVFRCKAASVSPISGHLAGMMAIDAIRKKGD